MVTLLSISFSIPSQYTPPSLVLATLVKMVFFMMVFIAVPGATPKKPFSGLMALRTPSLSNFIQAM